MSGTPFAVAERAHAYVRVADDLWEKIRSGTLTAGARLPAHRVMAEEYDVSDIIIRRAVELLRTEPTIAWPGSSTSRRERAYSSAASCSTPPARRAR